jgi:glycosyltransferase involved in cell wall biosynthesis
MKIALVVPHLYVGGMEMFVLRLGGYLLRQGNEVTVVATEEPGEWWPRVSDLGMQGLSIPLIGSFNRLTHVRRVHEALNGFDVLIMNDTRYGQAALPELPEGIVAIAVIHNDCRSAYEVGCNNVQALDALVSVGPRIQEATTARVGDGIVSQIYYGIAVPQFTPLVKRPSISGTPKLIYAGRMIQEQKGIFLLPQILTELNKAGLRSSLDIVGDGIDLPELKQRVARAGVEDQVIYWGALSVDEVGRKLQESHILLMPSFYEGFGIISLEAQGCGCVPVVSRLPGATDVNVLDGMTGLLAEAGNAKSFADSILALTNDPAKWQSMSEAGAQRIRNEFSVEKMGERYCRLIEEIRSKKQGKLDAPRPGWMWNPKLIGWTAPLPNSICRKLKIL